MSHDNDVRKGSQRADGHDTRQRGLDVPSSDAYDDRFAHGQAEDLLGYDARVGAADDADAWSGWIRSHLFGVFLNAWERHEDLGEGGVLGEEGLYCR